MAGIGLRGMRLKELVYADDICLLQVQLTPVNVHASPCSLV